MTTAVATDVVTAYAESVVAGHSPACRLAKLACERHLRDLEEGPARGLVWDPEDAQYVIDFVELMPQRKGEWQGKPIALMDWQQFRIGGFFGWKRNGVRRFRTAYTEIPRGQGKTTEAAAIANYLAWEDGERDAAFTASGLQFATVEESGRLKLWNARTWQVAPS